jgi:predicted transposase YdaD
MAKLLPSPHNCYFLFNFSRLPLVRNLLENYAGPEILTSFDLSTLRISSGSFVDDELRQSQADLLFEADLLPQTQQTPPRRAIRSGPETGFLRLLLEHKSYQDSETPFQVMKYQMRVWEQQMRAGEPRTPIVSMVLYHGEHPWNTHRSLQSLLDYPLTLRPCSPDLTFPIIDLCAMRDEEIRGEPLLQFTLRLLKYIRSPTLEEQLDDLLAQLALALKFPLDLDILRAVLIYLHTATSRLTMSQITQSFQTVFQSIGQPVPGSVGELLIQQGMEKGMEKGMKKGVEKGTFIGKIQLLEELLGAEPTAREKLEGRSLEELSTQAATLQSQLIRRQS